jgi:hypothetical protein
MIQMIVSLTFAALRTGMRSSKTNSGSGMFDNTKCLSCDGGSNNSDNDRIC